MDSDMTAPSGNNPASMIPASQRPDGTWRKARRVKDGYVPQEEKPVYESKGTKILRSIPSHPLGLHPEDIEKHNINKKIVGMAPTNEEARAKEKKEKKKNNNNKGGAGGKKKEDAFEITFEMPWLKIDDEESGANKTKKENKENVKASSSNKKSNAKNEPKEGGGAKKDKSKEDKTNKPDKKEVPKAKNDSNKDKTNNTNKTKSKKKK